MRSMLNRTRGRRSASRIAALAASLMLGAGSACVCPAPAAEVADAGFQTPVKTLRSFQAYMASDLIDWEYRCYSRDFRRQNGISLATYAEVRAQMLAKQPWLKLFAKGEILRDWPNADGSHGIEVRVPTRTVHVILVREDSFEIFEGDQLLEDGYADYDRLVQVVSSPYGDGIQAQIPSRRSAAELSRATSLRVARRWKIAALNEVDPDDPEPAP